MIFLPIAIVLYIAAAAVSRNRTLSYGFSCIASAVGLVLGVLALTSPIGPYSLRLFGRVSLVLVLSEQSGVFLLISSLSGILLSIFSIGYGKLYGQRSAAAFALGFASVILIVSAGDAITFLAGWELMTIFSFLMMTDRERSGTGVTGSPLTSAAFRFLIFGEISSILLLAGFGVLFAGEHTLTFSAVSHTGPAFLILTTLGFAVKMDIIPFHVWMPGVYEHTGDHVSAFLSVPLTLMGVYGLERVLAVSSPAVFWFVILILLGSASAFWGALQAAVSRKLKSLPAYSTTENNGMILAVMATAALAGSYGTKSLMYLAQFAAAAGIVLVLAHALAKSLLFMSIGHAKEALHVKTIDETRGVWSAVGPVPAVGIVAAGLSLSAFPPLLGYTGEWMVLETVFQSSRFQGLGERFFLIVSGVLIALAIGLAVFAMVKLIGYTALGYHHGRKARKVPEGPMKISQLTAIVLIPLCGIGVPFLLSIFGFNSLFGGLLGVPAPLLLQSGDPLFGVVSPTMFGVVILILSILPILIWRLRGKRTRAVDPWYGGSKLEEHEFFSEPAFSQILLHMLRRFYGTREARQTGIRQLHGRDLLSRPVKSIGAGIQRCGSFLSRRFMNGKVHFYILYIVVVFVLVLLLPWK